MKTITIKFLQAGSEIGSVEGSFVGFPGQGIIKWNNEKEISSLLGRSLPAVHYAQNFQASMEALAHRQGWKTTIKESGEWIVYDQNDLVEK